MSTIESIFGAFNGPAEVGRVIGVSTEHAAAMRRRRSIPIRYWPALLRAAMRSDPPRVTEQDLIAAHAPRASGDIEAHP